MNRLKSTLLAIVGTSLFVFAPLKPLLAQDHLWTDASGNYQVTAEYIAKNDTSIALQLEDDSLLIVEIAHLSKNDLDYLKEIERTRKRLPPAIDTTPEGEPKNSVPPEKNRWELRNGKTLYGEVVEHGRRLVEIRKRGSTIYVNDRSFKNLPEFYQTLLPEIVNHFEKIKRPEDKIEDFKQLGKWLAKQKSRSKSYTVEGVLMETNDGDLYGVPFFMFNESDLVSLKSGWGEWLKADEDAKYQAELALHLRAQALTRQRHEAEARQLQRLHVELQAYDAGLFDLWKVVMLPPQNQFGIPVQVIVPGRNSAQAEQAARMKFPNYQIGSIAKIQRLR